MKRLACLLFPFIVLADSATVEDDSIVANEEVAALQRRTKGLDSASGHKGRVSTLEQQMNEVYTDTVRDTFGAKAASARPQLTDNYNLYVSADLLYWKGYEGGSDFASTTVNRIGSSHFTDFNWRWGFRAELGYRLPHDGWDLAAHYTWFYDKARNTAQAAPVAAGGGLTPLWSPYYTSVGTTATASWTFHFDDADLSLQKSYFLSRHFSLSPFAALRTTWIDQSRKAVYTVAGVSTVVQKGTNDFWGIGPKAGVASRWFINRNWNLFANCAGSLLYAEFDVNTKTYVNGAITNNLNGDLHRIVPTVQGGIGFGWEMNFSDNSYHVAANVAYEAQYWWRQNQLFAYFTTSNTVRRLSEDLGLHGLTINALFDF